MFNESINLYEIKQNGLEYEEIRKLMSIQSRKENRKYVSFMHQKIEQEEVIEYRVDYCKASYEHENTQKIDYIEPKSCLIKSSECVSVIH